MLISQLCHTHFFTQRLIYMFQMKSLTPGSAEVFLKISRESMSKCKHLQRGKDLDISSVFLAHFMSLGVVHCNEIGRLPAQREDVQELLTMSLELVMYPKSGFTELPSAVLQHILRCDPAVSVEIWKNASFSEEMYFGMVMKQVQEKIPGLLLHDADFAQGTKCIQGRAEDHSIWLTVCGTFMEKVEVMVKTLMPGRSPTKLQVNEQDRVAFADTLSECEILRLLHSNQKHKNVAQLIAYSTESPVMFAVEHYEVTLLQRLYNARGNNEELSIQWKVDRCQEMTRAIDFLHHHNIIHREIMAESFSLSFHGPSHEVAILTSLSRATTNDVVGNSTIMGHVRGAYLNSFLN